MTKRIISFLTVMLFTASIFAGCGASKKAESKSGANQMADQAAYSMDSIAKTDREVKQTAGASGTKPEAAMSTAAAPEKKPEQPKDAGNALALTGTEVQSQYVPNPILAQRKVIRNANVTVEVESFDEAYGRIKSIISAFGFVQESNIKKEPVIADGEKKFITRGVIIIRVDRDRFESVLTDVKGLGTLLDENIKSDDITDKFFDTESRVRVLKIEQDRLEDFLKRLNDADTIFKTQKRLTEIRQEIEGLTGTLRKWSDLVDLSTITINMREKVPGSLVLAKDKSYWQQLADAFLNSSKGVAAFCGGLVIFLVSAFPVLILLGIFGFILLVVYRRFFKGSTKGIVEKKDDIQN